jgi:hypothetical protein
MANLSTGADEVLSYDWLLAGVEICLQEHELTSSSDGSNLTTACLLRKQEPLFAIERRSPPLNGELL